MATAPRTTSHPRAAKAARCSPSSTPHYRWFSSPPRGKEPCVRGAEAYPAAPMLNTDVTLYQFELCPYCHKVRAGLELKGIPYRKVEVNPMNKRELPKALPADAPKKVPVLAAGGKLIWDSTEILKFIDREQPEGVRFLPEA